LVAHFFSTDRHVRLREGQCIALHSEDYAENFIFPRRARNVLK